MNSYYLKKMTPAELTQLCLPHLQKAGLVETDLTADKLSWLEQVVAAVQKNGIRGAGSELRRYFRRRHYYR